MTESTGRSEAEEVSADTAEQRFQDVFHRFTLSMEAVSDLKEFAAEHASQLDDVQERFQRRVSTSMPDAPEEQRLQATEIVRRRFAEIEDAFRMGQEKEDEAEPPEATAIMEGMQADLARILDHPTAFFDYLLAYFHARYRPARVPVMYSSLLTTAVGNFEVLVAGIVREFLRIKPEVLRTDDAKYSMADVEGFESLDEFREHCTERYAEALLRGSFEDWMVWFDKRLKIKLGDLTVNPVHVREVFQRRHLIVHNGGVVNRSYLVKMPEIQPAPEIGKPLRIDEDYLARAIDGLTAVGVLLMVAVMRRLLAIGPDQKHPADIFASGTAYEFLQMQRWELVIQTTAGALDGCVSEYERLLLMVNQWIARKRLDGVGAIRTEVEAWQVDSLSPRFRLAKLALLDQTADADALATRLVEIDELSESEVRGWPLLKEVRANRAIKASINDADAS